VHLALDSAEMSINPVILSVSASVSRLTTPLNLAVFCKKSPIPLSSPHEIPHGHTRLRGNPDSKKEKIAIGGNISSVTKLIEEWKVLEE